jgi:hypothetical protein
MTNLMARQWGWTKLMDKREERWGRRWSEALEPVDSHQNPGPVSSASGPASWMRVIARICKRACFMDGSDCKESECE